MKLTLYTSTGEELFDIIPASSSGQDWSLMSDNKLSVTFDLETCVLLLPGCYVDFEGSRFYLLEEYKPTMINTSLWRYNVSFKDAASWMAITIALNLIDGQNKPIFNYTAPAAEHAAIIVANLNRRMNTTAWKVGSVIDTPNITIEYAGKYCSEILQEIVDGQKTEWWIDDMTLNIGRAEFGDIIELGYQQGLLGDIVCQKADDMRSYAYLYPVGSTRNIDPTKYGYDRLQLPDGQTRVDMNVEQGVAELVEEAAFSGIYPRYVGKVTEVSTSVGTSDDGSQYVIYFIQDDQIPFNPNDYELPGEVKHVTFQSGELMGADFEVNYNNERREFEIITQWSKDGAQLPGGTLVPAVGDEYVVWNITMPDEYYPLASQEFLEAAEAFAKVAIQDASVYEAPMDYIYVQEKGLRLRPGQRVRLVSDKYFSKGYYDSRVTRITRNLSNPNALNIDVSAVRVIGTIQQLQNAVKSSATQVTQISNTVQTVVRTVDNAVTLTGNQRVQGVKNFVDGVRIGGLFASKLKDDTLYFDGNIVLRGGLTMYGKNTTTSPSIFSVLPIDGVTIGRNEKGELCVIGGTGGGGIADSVAWSNVTNKPTWITDTKPKYSYSEILDTPDLSVYATKSSVSDISTQLNDFLSGSDTDTIINKWKELEVFLSGLSESDNLATLLSSKASKATTLAGYGITDAYTKKQVDNAISSLNQTYVTIAGAEQRITAEHNFVNGFKVGGLPIKKSQDKTLYLDANLVVSGAITMYGSGSTTFPTIWENIPFDSTMKWDGSKWSVVGSSGSGSGLDLAQLEEYLTTNGYIISTSSITGNAATATKLKNSVSLWGRSFDGSANLTGSLNVTTGEGYRISYNGYDLRFIISGSTANRGIWDNTNNEWLMYRPASTNIFFPQGNIAIGSHTAPTERLTVTGNIKATSFIGSLTGRLVEEVVTDLNNATVGRIFTITSGYGSTAGNKPTDGWVTGLTLQYAQNGTYRRQLAFCDDLYFRRESNAIWDAWRKILDDSNYHEYALPIKGGTVNGNVRINKFLAVGAASSATNTARAQIHLVSSGANPCDLYFGADDTLYWCVTTRNAADAGGFNKAFALYDVTNSAYRMMMFPNGNLAIGGTTASEKLHVYGNVVSTGAFNSYSANSHYYVKGKEIVGSYLTNYYLFDSAPTDGYTSHILGNVVHIKSGSNKTSALTANADGTTSIHSTLKLPAVDSGFTNPRITFGDSVIRIGATTAGLLGVYASGDIRLNPNSASSANGTMGLWLKASGYNGINISSPTQALHVNGKGIFADATNPWISLQRDGVNWYLQVTSGGLRLGRTSANAMGVDESGNIQTPGAITMFYSSDERLKKNVRKVDASKILMSLGGVYQYEYIATEVAKNSIYAGSHFGLIYQNVKGTALNKMCYEREDKMGALNYVDADFISIIAGATMENISETEKLNRKIRTLEQKVKQLEKRTA